MDAGGHVRVIVHVDMDCFYAQVEERRRPTLAGRPLGVRQKNIVVTCNYEARAMGIRKCMLVEDALRVCPSLTLVPGEDLAPYRQASAQVTALLQQFSPLVERLGLDENFVDVTQLVNRRLKDDPANRSGDSADKSLGSDFDRSFDSLDRSTSTESLDSSMEARYTSVNCVDKSICDRLSKSRDAMDQTGDSPVVNGNAPQRKGSVEKMDSCERSDSALAEEYVYNDDYGSCHCGCRERLAEGSRVARQMREAIRRDLQLTCCAGIAHNKLLAKLVCSVNKPNKQTTLFPGPAVRHLLNSLKNVRSLPGIGSRMTDTLKSLGITSVAELQTHPLAALRSALGTETALRLKNNSLGVDDTEVKASGRPQSIGLEDGFKRVSMQSEVRDKMSTLLGRLLKLVEEDGRLPTTIRVTVRKLDRVRGTSHRESRQSNVVSILPDRLMNTIMMLFNKMVNMAEPFHLTLMGLAFTKFRERGVGRGSVANFLVRDLSVQTLTSLESVGCGGSGGGSSRTLSRSSYTPSESGSESEPELEPSPKKTRSDCGRDLMSPSKLRVSDMCLAARGARTSLDESVLRELPPDIRMEVLEAYSSGDEQSDVSMDSAMANGGCGPSGTGGPSGPSRQPAPEANEKLPGEVDPDVFRQLPPELQADLRKTWSLTKCRQNKTRQNSIRHYMVTHSD